MTSTSPASLKPEPFWRRWWRWLGAFEAAMEMTYDDLQDRRMDRLETEIGRLRAEIEARPAPTSRA